MKLPCFTLPKTILLSTFLLISTPAIAETLNVAVASNFVYTLRLLAEDFESRTGHKLRISSASTGKIYSQLLHGAPFDVFLAADENRPDRLIAEGKAKPGHAHTYALGKLVLLSNIKQKNNCRDILKTTALKHLAIANPKTAPYGSAAKQVLEKIGLWQSLQAKLVMGENIAQTLQFVSTTNAEAGFVAKSMLLQNGNVKSSCTWDVPADFHTPIKQKMIVLSKSSKQKTSMAFLNYMQSSDAAKIIKQSGYGVL